MTVRALCLAFAFMCLFACRGTAPPGDTIRGTGLSEDDPRANLILYVGNQSAERPFVDIEVSIDGKAVVRGVFDGSTFEKRHSRATYPLHLEPGAHVLRAFSEAGEARLEERIAIAPDADRRWAQIMYYFSSGGKRGATIAPVLDFQIRNEPIFIR